MDIIRLMIFLAVSGAATASWVFLLLFTVLVTEPFNEEAAKAWWAGIRGEELSRHMAALMPNRYRAIKYQNWILVLAIAMTLSIVLLL